MEELRELFIKHLTENTKLGWATAIFDKDNGLPLWSEIRLDMIMQVFDGAINEKKSEL